MNTIDSAHKILIMLEEQLHSKCLFRFQERIMTHILRNLVVKLVKEFESTSSGFYFIL